MARTRCWGIAGGWVAGCLLLGSTSHASPGDVVIDLLPEMPVAAQDFADAIAIEGNLVVVGAENTDIGPVISAGSVFLFDATTGEQLLQITPDGPAAPRAFGTSVAIGGGRILVGAEE